MSSNDIYSCMARHSSEAGRNMQLLDNLLQRT